MHLRRLSIPSISVKSQKRHFPLTGIMVTQPLKCFIPPNQTSSLLNSLIIHTYWIVSPHILLATMHDQASKQTFMMMGICSLSLAPAATPCLNPEQADTLFFVHLSLTVCELTMLLFFFTQNWIEWSLEGSSRLYLITGRLTPCQYSWVYTGTTWVILWFFLERNVWDYDVWASCTLFSQIRGSCSTLKPWLNPRTNIVWITTYSGLSGISI